MTSRIIKFVENPDLDAVSTFLTERPMGCVVLNGKLEIFQIEGKSPSPTSLPPSPEQRSKQPSFESYQYGGGGGGTDGVQGQGQKGIATKPQVKISINPKGAPKPNANKPFVPTNPNNSNNNGTNNGNGSSSSSNNNNLPGRCSASTATTTPATSLGSSPITSSSTSAFTLAQPLPMPALPAFPHLLGNHTRIMPIRQMSDPQEWASNSRRPRSNSAQSSCDTNSMHTHSTTRVVINGKSKIIVGSTAQQLQALHPSSKNNRKRSSSLSDLNETSSKQILADIVAVLNESFPDYDFSSIRTKQIVERDIVSAMQVVNAYLSELTAPSNTGNDGGVSTDENLMEKLWKHVDDAINLRRCDVYSYMTDNEGDPFSSGAIWSFNYFFFNREIKRICFFHCVATR
jgi:hypothetical protein